MGVESSIYSITWSIKLFNDEIDGKSARESVLLTSAPAEKKRPDPVRTVMIDVGSSFNSRIAATVSSINFPPKELRLLGRLN